VKFSFHIVEFVRKSEQLAPCHGVPRRHRMGSGDWCKMIISEQEVTERIESPLNLINRLRVATRGAQSRGAIQLPPKAGDIIEDLDKKLALGSIKTKAAGIISAALDEIKNKIPGIDSPKELAKIVGEMSKITFAKDEEQQRSGNNVQVVLFSPSKMKTEDEYEVVNE